SDTVGFIRDLPPLLVASFRATLEEAIHADLLLHVADASNPALLEQIEAVETVLEQLGLEEKPTLLVANKIDAIADESILPLLRDRYPQVVEISAVQGTGLDELVSRVAQETQRDIHDLVLSIAVGDGKALQFIERYGEVRETVYEGDRAIISLSIPDRALEHLHTIASDVRHVSEEPEQ
ncbi:MAG: GTPase HflX, partial [Phycisphaerae bacterium]